MDMAMSLTLELLARALVSYAITGIYDVESTTLNTK